MLSLFVVWFFLSHLLYPEDPQMCLAPDDSLNLHVSVMDSRLPPGMPSLP